MASIPAGSPLRFEDPGRDPAHDHGAVAPAPDVVRQAAGHALETLDRVRTAQSPVERSGQAEPPVRAPRRASPAATPGEIRQGVSRCIRALNRDQLTITTVKSPCAGPACIAAATLASVFRPFSITTMREVITQSRTDSVPSRTSRDAWRSPKLVQ